MPDEIINILKENGWNVNDNDMVVTAPAMEWYRRKMMTISDKATKEIQKYIQDNKYIINETFTAYAMGMADKYGYEAGEITETFCERLRAYWKDPEKYL